MVSLPQDSFGSGEISPRFQGRFTTELFGNSLKLSRNTIGLNEGGVTRRWGTKFLLDIGAEGVLVPYSVRNVGEFILVFTDLRVRAYTASGATNGFDEVTPYAGVDLQELRWVQDPNGERIRLVHPSYQPRYIPKSFNGIFKLDYNLTGPRLEEFARTFQLTRGLPATPVAGLAVVNLEAGADFFRSSDQTNWFQLDINTWYRVEAIVSPRLVFAHETPDGGIAAGTSTNAWNGPFVLDRAVAVNLTAPAISNGQIVNVTATGTPFNPDDVGALLDMDAGAADPTVAQIVGYVSSSEVQVVGISAFGGATFTSGIEIFKLADREITGRATITPDDISGTVTLTASSATFDAQMAPTGDEDGAIFFLNNGVARVTAFTDPLTVTAEVLSPFTTRSPSNLWSKGWSRSSGFPSAIALHQNRVVYGGVEEFGSTVFMSETGRLESFRGGADDDSAMRLPIATNAANVIRAFASQGKNLLVLTRDSEIIIEGNPITPTTLNAQVQSEFGSESAIPVLIDNFVIFVGIGGDKVRSSAFRFADDLYRTSDISEHADHFFEGKSVYRLEQIKRPEQLVFALNTNNEVYCCSFSPSNRVLHWSYFEGLKVHSVCRFPASSASDVVWLLVERSVNGSTEYYVESLSPSAPLDSSVTYTTPDLASFTGLDHLEGETVSILTGDDVTDPTKPISNAGSKVVTGGAVSPTVMGATAMVGLPFTSKMRPQILVYTPPGFGSTAGKNNLSNIARLLVVNSLAGILTHTDNPEVYPIIPADLQTRQIPKSEWVEVCFSAPGRNEMITFEMSGPHRFELAAVNIDHSSEEKEGI